MKTIISLLTSAILLSFANAKSPPPIDLSGEWSVRLDPKDIGESQKWWAESFAETCKLPGSLAENALGDPVGFDTKWDMNQRHIDTVNNGAREFEDTGKFLVIPWLNPHFYYVGKAWYQKTIDLPLGKQDWKLHLERTQWSTTVWVNGRKIGYEDSLHTPHEYVFEASGPCQIVICIDNSRVHAIGTSSHSRSDQTQGTWNGIIGKMTLEPAAAVNLEELQWFPNYGSENLEVLFSAKDLSGPEQISVELLLVDDDTKEEVARSSVALASCLDNDGNARLKLAAPGVKAWDEFDPQLYTATIRLVANGKVLAEQANHIGFRDVSVQGNRLLLNGKPLFMRSTLDCAIFPLTGYPPTDEAHWRRIFSQIKAYGCNSVRFHSWCPPEAAFAVANELGLYLQPEMCWASAGRGESIDKWLYEEGERILSTYGHHPSFMFFACGNEMDGPNGDRTITYPPFFDIPGKQSTFDRIMRRMPGAQYLSEWVTHFDARTDLQLVAGSAGWPYIEEEHFHMHHEPLRLSGIYNLWGPRSDWDYSSILTAYKRSLVSHESGQWGAFPSLDVAKKYTGVYSQDILEATAIRLKKSGIYNQHRDFTLSSGKTQVVFYKESIEALMRTPELGGYQLLSLQEFTGQNTAICGPLDPFWEDKGYSTAPEFATFNGPTVPLAMMNRRVWENTETFSATVRLAHYGREDLPAGEWKYSIESASGKQLSGTLSAPVVKVGEVIELGSIEAALNDFKRAEKLTLSVARADGQFRNDWNIWVYPKTPAAKLAAEETLVTKEFNDEARAVLAKGGTVILSPELSQMSIVRNNSFQPMFWVNATLPSGLLIQKEHSALTDFPTDEFQDLQWYEPLKNSTSVPMVNLPSGIQPIIQVIDNMYRGEKLALVFEAKCLGGKLVFSAINLVDDLENRPVSRQLRRSLEKYVGTNEFNPEHEVNEAQLKSIAKFKVPKKLGALSKNDDGVSVRVSSEVLPKFSGQNLIDGDVSTLWHTPWKGDVKGFPHSAEILFSEPVQLEGVELIARAKDARNRPRNVNFYLSLDGRNWGKPVMTHELKNSSDAQTFLLPIAQTAKAVKVEIIDCYGPGPWTTLAEIIPIAQFGELAGDRDSSDE